MGIPFVPVGFDYAKALLHIRQHRTYEQIAEFCGYANPSSIQRLLAGSPPAHPQGEAIYVLYQQIFGRKPPMTHDQASGEFIHYSVSPRPLSTA